MSNDPKRKESTKKQAIASLIIETSLKIAKNKGENIMMIMAEHMQEMERILSNNFSKGGE